MIVLGRPGEPGDIGPDGNDGLNGIDGLLGKDGSVLSSAILKKTCIICPPGPQGPNGQPGIFLNNKFLLLTI